MRNIVGYENLSALRSIYSESCCIYLITSWSKRITTGITQGQYRNEKTRWTWSKERPRSEIVFVSILCAKIINVLSIHDVLELDDWFSSTHFGGSGHVHSVNVQYLTYSVPPSSISLQHQGHLFKPQQILHDHTRTSLFPVRPHVSFSQRLRGDSLLHYGRQGSPLDTEHGFSYLLPHSMKSAFSSGIP